MKTKILCFMSSILMTLGFAACSGSEEFPEIQQPAQKGNYKIEIGIGKMPAGTRTVLSENVEDGAYEWFWEEGADEKLILTDKDGAYVATLNLQTIDEDENWAIFRGVSEEQISVTDDYRITYMGRGNDSFNKSDMTFSVNLGAQDGTREALGLCDASSEKIKFTQDTSDQVYYNSDPVILQKLFSIVHFKLTDHIANPTATALRGQGVYLGATVKINGASVSPTVTPTDETTVTLEEGNELKCFNFNKGNTDLFLTMVAGKVVKPIFKRTYEKGVAYGTPGTTKEAGLSAGSIYEVPVDMKFNSPMELTFTYEVTEWGNIESKPQIWFGGKPQQSNN